MSLRAHPWSRWVVPVTWWEETRSLPCGRGVALWRTVVRGCAARVLRRRHGHRADRWRRPLVAGVARPSSVATPRISAVEVRMLATARRGRRPLLADAWNLGSGPEPCVGQNGRRWTAGTWHGLRSAIDRGGVWRRPPATRRRRERPDGRGIGLALGSQPVEWPAASAHGRGLALVARVWDASSPVVNRAPPRRPVVIPRMAGESGEARGTHAALRRTTVRGVGSPVLPLARVPQRLHAVDAARRITLLGQGLPQHPRRDGRKATGDLDRDPPRASRLGAPALRERGRAGASWAQSAPPRVRVMGRAGRCRPAPQTGGHA
jgi:hypothetical protein